ncbi:MAG: phosphoribosylformylglycinamidine synthase subunit PurS [bacterium]
MKARIHITLKAGILDPQGKTILHALEVLGFANINEARVGKLIELTFEGVSPARARELAEAACQKLLANPVIEDYSLVVVDD